MKASEALIAGSLKLYPMAGNYFDGDTSDDSICGCAIGMMVVGATTQRVDRRDAMDVHLLKFPWMFRATHNPVPCGCTEEILWRGKTGMTITWDGAERIPLLMMIHLFETHVINGSWTIEKLGEWLDTVEK
jgi:hypothetical protein